MSVNAITLVVYVVVYIRRSVETKNILHQIKIVNWERTLIKKEIVRNKIVVV